MQTEVLLSTLDVAGEHIVDVDAHELSVRRWSEPSRADMVDSAAPELCGGGLRVARGYVQTLPPILHLLAL